MQKLKSTQKKTHKLMMIIALSLVGAGIYLFAAWQYQLIPFSLFNKSYEPGEQIINMKRTDTEKQATKTIEDNPERKLQNTQTDKPKPPVVDSTSGKQVVNVMITSASIRDGVVNASGMVTNLVEAGGECIYVFKQGEQVVLRPVSTSTNATSTTCTRLTMPASELSRSGVWKVTLRYNSVNAEGVSSEREITW